MSHLKKVFSINRFTKTFETDYRFTVVVWACVDSITKSTYKVSNLCVSVYSRGELVGHSGNRFSKSISVKKNLSNLDTNGLVNKAIQSAYITVLSRGQVFNGTVLYFDNARSSGLVNVHGVGQVEINGCNAHNALTCFNETCCIELSKGQVISLRLANMGDHLTVTDYTGNFNQALSDKLDHSKLAFLRHKNKIVSGLMA